jgi:hypothetical protein
MNAVGRLGLWVTLMVGFGLMHPEYPGTLNVVLLLIAGLAFVMGGRDE